MFKLSIGLTFLVVVLAGCASAPETKSQTRTQNTASGDIVLQGQWPDEVIETSGLAYFSDHYWTINDSGDGPFVYAINKQRALVKKVRIAGARNIDWEALAEDELHLYIADCGNNRGHRNQLQIYKVSKQTLSASLVKKQLALVDATKMQIRYAGKPKTVSPKSHNYDCEALVAVGDELWLFTKNRQNEQTDLYRYSKKGAIQTRSAHASYPVEGLITDADYDAETGKLVLLGYSKNRIFGRSFVWQVPTQEVKGKREIVWKEALLTKLNPYAQWEAIIWQEGSSAKKAILTSEKSPLLDVSIGELDLQ